MGKNLALVTPPPTLDDLAAALESARAREARARKSREELEDKLAAILGHEEKAHAFESDKYITVTRSSLVRSVDQIGVTTVADELGPELVSTLFPLRHRLDVEAYLDLRKSDPDKFRIASRAVTLRHARPTITITRREG